MKATMKKMFSRVSWLSGLQSGHARAYAPYVTTRSAQGTTLIKEVAATLPGCALRDGPLRTPIVSIKTTQSAAANQMSIPTA